MLLKYIRDESGATAIEYGLIAALIALAVIAGGTRLGDAVSQKFIQVGWDVIRANVGG